MNRLRRIGLCAFVAVVVLTTGCDNPQARKAAGSGIVEVGVVVAWFPHPYAKVIGAAIIAAGTVLLVEAELADGSKEQVKFDLTDEQKKTLADGGEVKVVDPNGKETKVTPSKR